MDKWFATKGRLGSPIFGFDRDSIVYPGMRFLITLTDITLSKKGDSDE
jgi:hypothetical protein